MNEQEISNTALFFFPLPFRTANLHASLREIEMTYYSGVSALPCLHKSVGRSVCFYTQPAEQQLRAGAAVRRRLWGYPCPPQAGSAYAHQGEMLAGEGHTCVQTRTGSAGRRLWHPLRTTRANARLDRY